MAAATAPERVAAAGPTKTVVFTGKYSGHATLLINNGSVTIPSVTGSGSGTLLGPSQIAGKGSASASAQCDPFTGKGSITGHHGEITLFVSSTKASGCSSGSSGPVTVTFNGTATVTGGSGTAKGASGSLKFTGTLALAGTSGTQDGQYKVTLSGKLSVKG